MDVQQNYFPMATSESGQVENRRQQERSHSPRPEDLIRGGGDIWSQVAATAAEKPDNQGHVKDQVCGEGPSLLGGETRMRIEKEAEAHLELEKRCLSS